MNTVLDYAPTRIRSIYVHHHNERYLQHVGCIPPYWSRPFPRWDGGRYRGRTYPPIWPTVADFLLAHDLEPIGCIGAQFAPLDDSEVARPPFPEPDALATDGARQRYERFLASRKHRSAMRFKIDINCLQFELRYYRTVRPELAQLSEAAADLYVFRAVREKLSPLFRHCVAVKFGDSHVADESWRAAVETYLECPAAYDATWADFIPNTVRREALIYRFG